MISRLALGGTVLALAITPWVVTAIVGVLSSNRGFDDDMLALAAPSPAFVFVAVVKLDKGSNAFIPVVAAATGIAYWILGFVLLFAANRKSKTIIEKHEVMLAQTDRLLEEEDLAADLAREAADAAQAAAQAAPGAAVSGWGEQAPSTKVSSGLAASATGTDPGASSAGGAPEGGATPEPQPS
jgi:hypothetical protein